MAPQLMFVMTFLAAFAAQLFAATPRCDLAVPAEGAINCLDPHLWNGQTITLPGNVTRIGGEGLALCASIESSKFSSDIVYVIDNSTSMEAWGYWVSSAGDTSFFTPGCSQNVSKLGDPLLRPRHLAGHTGADSIGFDTVQQIVSKERPNCTEANDVYSWRAEAVRQALLSQAAFDPTSSAGVIQFSGVIRQALEMRPLSDANRQVLLDSTGLLPVISGTKWAPPLKEAIDWMAKFRTTHSQAIILVSDGEPSDANQYRALVGGDDTPPIYAVYLGQSEDKTPELDFVTSVTGGEKFVVPPDQPDSLQGVINAIVASVSRRIGVSQAVVENLSNGQVSVTKSVRRDSLSDRLILDSVVALQSGPNYVRIASTIGSGAALKPETTLVVLDVSGPEAPMGETPIGTSPFLSQCFEPTRLSLLDGGWKEVPFLSEGETQVGVLLQPSGTNPDLPLRVRTSSGMGDSEQVDLGNKDAIPPDGWGRKVPLAIARLTPAVPGNNGFEVRSGLDTLRADWCHPRDGRDCAEASLEVRALRAAQLRWVPSSLPSYAGTFGLEANLPGQKTKTVSVTISRHGVPLATVTLAKQKDSLYQVSVPFLQGPRRPTGDTLWLSEPSATTPDSLVATLVWSLDNSLLSDTALVIRNLPRIQVEWTGVGQMVQVTLDGGIPDSRKELPVRLSVGTRTLGVSLDSTGRALLSMTTLVAGGPEGLATVRGSYVDPIFGDTLSDSTQVPVPSTFLRYSVASSLGPVGILGLEASLPGVPGSSVLVTLWRRDRSLGNVRLNRMPDSTFSGAFYFRQGPLRPGADTVWIAQPNSLVPDSIGAFLVYAPSGDTLRDTALVIRPPMSLVLQPGMGSTVSLQLTGGETDLRGQRVAQVSATRSLPVALDEFGTGNIDLLEELASIGGEQFLVQGWFIDPVYGDTARDSLVIPVPRRSLSIVSPVVSGPRGHVEVRLVDPWSSGLTRTILVAHGRDTVRLVLQRNPGGDFSGEVPFSQAMSTSGDTLRLGRPLAGIDSLFAVLPVDRALPALSAGAIVQRPPLRLVLAADPAAPQNILIKLDGGNADARGEATVLLTGPGLLPSTQLTQLAELSWQGARDLLELLPESLHPVLIEGRFIDPIYGDTAKSLLEVVSPWFPGTISVNPAKADPRAGDSVTIRVTDRDVDPLRPGTLVVTVGNTRLELRETGKNTGEYRLRVPAETVDPQWGRRSPRAPWLVTLTYQDPDHAEDLVRTNLELEFDVPPAEVDPHEPLRKVESSSSSPKPVFRLVKPDSRGKFPQGDQGAMVRIWEPTDVSIYLYDNIGIAIGHWEGVLYPKDAETSADYLLAWNGRDEIGIPVTPGVYLLRAVLIAQDGSLLANKVFRIGRK
ncbi:MAG: VWA domain-containing protein [Fibrobacteria bacterium]|nr:VWA domain-containing protein [Fibrobacteria bacterium]